MAVRDFMAVGRLRGAEKAAADAAIAISTFASLLIFENMIAAPSFCVGAQLDTPFWSSRFQLCESEVSTVRVQSDCRRRRGQAD
jgi:hypothetical protein